MKISAFAAAAVCWAYAFPVSAQLLPDLVVSETSVTPQRVGVGEEFVYTVTVKNIGWAPCNWLTFQLFGTDDLSELVRVIPDVGINCDREICSGGPLFLLFPGQSIQAKFVQRANVPGLHGPAIATVDANRMCTESSERNNTGTSPTVQIIERPKLSLIAFRPPASNVVQTFGTYTVAVTNTGRGVATDVSFVFPLAGTVQDTAVTSAHFGPRPSPGTVETGAVLPVNCNTATTSVSKICTVAVRLGPGETFHAGVKSFDCQPLPRGVQSVTVLTADDTSPNSHTLGLQRACATGSTTP